MKRNIILMGGKTFVVSLPAEWVRQNGLKKGQEIDVVSEADKLTIIAGNQEKERKIVIIDNAQNIEEKLIKAYQLGYDEIKITAEVNAKELQETVNNYLNGFEILSTEKGCIISSVSELAEKEFEPLLRRAFLLMRSKDTTTALRLISMCKRFLSRNGYKNFQQSLLTFNLLCDMEKAIECKKINKDVIENIYNRFSVLSFDEVKEIEKNNNYKFLTAALQDIALVRTGF